MDQDEAAYRAMKQASGQTGVPVIVAGDIVIVGFDQEELAKLEP